jgi:hypothetical protein
MISSMHSLLCPKPTFSTPIQSGSLGSVAERNDGEPSVEPILDGVIQSGSFIDIGCANGYSQRDGSLTKRNPATDDSTAVRFA